MSDSQLARLTTAELVELRSRVNRVIASKRTAERVALRQRFKAMAAQAGFSWTEVSAAARPRRGRRTAVKRGSSAKSAKLAKYVNPDNPQETWSGLGRKPNWLTAKLKAGAQQDDFRT